MVWHSLLLLLWNTEFAGSNNFEAKFAKEFKKLQHSVFKKKKSLKSQVWYVLGTQQVLWRKGGNPIMPNNQGIV